MIQKYILIQKYLTCDFHALLDELHADMVQFTEKWN